MKMRGGEINLLMTVGFNYEDGKLDEAKQKVLDGFKGFIATSPMPLFIKHIDGSELKNLYPDKPITTPQK